MGKELYLKRFADNLCARRETRTPMGLLPLDPEPSVSTNFTIRAIKLKILAVNNPRHIM